MLVLRYPGLRCLLIVGLQIQIVKAEEVTICNYDPNRDCCKLPRISEDTFSVEYDVLITGNDGNPYNVTATITWEPPTHDVDYAYSIDFMPKFTPDDVKNFRASNIQTGLKLFKCTEDSTCNEIPGYKTVTDKPVATFGDLLFGFPHVIRVQVISNNTVSAKIQCVDYIKYRRLDTPDCFQTTGNLDYCKNQTIPFSSVPRDLKVDVELPRDSAAVILHVSWKKPLFVNGYIKNTTITAYKIEQSSSTAVFQDKIVPNDTTSVTLFSENVTPIMNGGLLRGFSYDIVVIPEVVLPAEVKIRAIEGNAALERIYISDPTITGTTPPAKTTPTAPMENEPPVEVYFVIAGIAGVLLFVLGLFLLLLRILSKKTKEKKQPEFIIRPSHHSVKAPVLPEFRDKEIMNIYDVEMGENAIGSGQFGEVFKATLNLRKGTLKKQTVAVKRTKGNLNASLKEEFLDEIRLMIEIGHHPNIMPLLACRTVVEPYYLITEYMKYGSLKDYLHKSSIPQNVSQDPNYDLTDLKKLQFSHQVSKGMEYLASTRYFHGDLAARNVLINEEMVAKISDFGLSNDIYAKGYVRLPAEQKRPVKWYSPEANHLGKCSTEGDVWSFGIVLYEIYSGGQEPYPGMLPREAVVRVKAGYRMERPENCPNQIYIIMRDCWQHEPSNRPSFELIRQSLDEMLSRGENPYIDPIANNVEAFDDDSSSEENADRVSVDSFIYDASFNTTNARMVPYIDEDQSLQE